MKKIIKVLLIGLLIFAGHKMLSAEEIEKDLGNGFILTYNSSNKGYMFSENAVKDLYANDVLRWDWTDPLSLLFPEDLTKYLNMVEEEYGYEEKNLINKTIMAAEKYGYAFLLNEETQGGLVVLNTKYGHFESESFYFWFFGNN